MFQYLDRRLEYYFSHYMELPYSFRGHFFHNLSQRDTVVDQLEEMLLSYGIRGWDYLLIVQQDRFCVYFQKHSAAVRFYLNWYL